MSTHNICFCREIRKILCGYPLLSVAMFAGHVGLIEGFVVSWLKIRKQYFQMLPTNI